MNKDIRIGTCGFRTNKLEYAESLKCVEIQHTFYQPPMIKTRTLEVEVKQLHERLDELAGAIAAVCR